MKTIGLSLLAAASLAFCAQAQAAPVIIDFDDILAPIIPTSAVVSNGFDVTSSGDGFGILDPGFGCGAGGCPENGTNRLLAGVTGTITPFTTQPITIASASAGEGFFLLTLEVAETAIEFASDPTAVVTDILLTGHLAGGGTVSELYTLDGIADGPGPLFDFESFFLSSAWTGALLTSLDIAGCHLGTDCGGSTFALDNIFVDTAALPEDGVPAPGALVLLGFGLIGLGVRRRTA